MDSVSEILSQMSLCIDTNKMLKYSEQETFAEEVLPLARLLGADTSDLLDNIKGSIYCAICKKKLFEILLQCKHPYCVACLKDLVYRCTDTKVLLTISEEYLKPECFICHYLIQADEYKFIFKDTLDSIVKDFKKRKSLVIETIGDKIKCYICGFIGNENKFMHQCKHICIHCTSKRLRNKTPECPVCNSDNIRPEIFNIYTTSKCGVCKKPKSYVYDSLLDICKGHLHCYNCLKRAWGLMKCIKCETELGLETLIRIYNQIFAKCYYCKNVLEFNFFIDKNCCIYMVCTFCQQKQPGNSCKYCKTQLSQKTIDYLNELL